MEIISAEVLPSEALPAEGLLGASWLLIALPLAGAAVLLLGGRRTDRWGHLLGTGDRGRGVRARRCCSPSQLAERRGPVGRTSTCSPSSRPVTSTCDAGLLYDPLSAVFVLLITGVGSLIHVYSIGYMAHDPGRRRFFAYLNLFVAAMLLLVLGNSYVALYVGWEGVGLASYLLIALLVHPPGGGHGGQEGVHHEPGRRRRPGPGDLPDVRPARHDVLRGRLRRRRRRWPAAPSPRSGCCCCSARAASPASSRCRPGCPTPWRARPRSRRSSTPRPWSPPAST